MNRRYFVLDKASTTLTPLKSLLIGELVNQGVCLHFTQKDQNFFFAKKLSKQTTNSSAWVFLPLGKCKICINND